MLDLQNKPKAEVHPGHRLTGPKEEENVGCSLTPSRLGTCVASLCLLFMLKNF
jgi:hypothetical protein